LFILRLIHIPIYFTYSFNEVRGIDAAMVVFQVYPDTTTAWAVLQIGWMLKYHGDVYFIYSLAHSVPNAYMDNKGSVQSTLLPPRWMLYVFLFCPVEKPKPLPPASRFAPSSTLATRCIRSSWAP